MALPGKWRPGGIKVRVFGLAERAHRMVMKAIAYGRLPEAGGAGAGMGVMQCDLSAIDRACSTAAAPWFCHG